MFLVLLVLLLNAVASASRDPYKGRGNIGDVGVHFTQVREYYTAQFTGEMGEHGKV